MSGSNKGKPPMKRPAEIEIKVPEVGHTFYVQNSTDAWIPTTLLSIETTKTAKKTPVKYFFQSQDSAKTDICIAFKDLKNKMRFEDPSIDEASATDHYGVVGEADATILDDINAQQVQGPSTTNHVNAMTEGAAAEDGTLTTGTANSVLMIDTVNTPQATGDSTALVHPGTLTLLQRARTGTSQTKEPASVASSYVDSIRNTVKTLDASGRISTTCMQFLSSVFPAITLNDDCTISDEQWKLYKQKPETRALLVLLDDAYTELLPESDKEVLCIFAASAASDSLFVRPGPERLRRGRIVAENIHEEVLIKLQENCNALVRWLPPAVSTSYTAENVSAHFQEHKDAYIQTLLAQGTRIRDNIGHKSNLLLDKLLVHNAQNRAVTSEKVAAFPKQTSDVVTKEGSASSASTKSKARTKKTHVLEEEEEEDASKLNFEKEVHAAAIRSLRDGKHMYGNPTGSPLHHPDGAHALESTNSTDASVLLRSEVNSILAEVSKFTTFSGSSIKALTGTTKKAVTGSTRVSNRHNGNSHIAEEGGGGGGDDGIDSEEEQVPPKKPLDARTWVPFSRQVLEEQRADEKTVFVIFDTTSEVGCPIIGSLESMNIDQEDKTILTVSYFDSQGLQTKPFEVNPSSTAIFTGPFRDILHVAFGHISTFFSSVSAANDSEMKLCTIDTLEEGSIYFEVQEHGPDGTINLSDNILLLRNKVLMDSHRNEKLRLGFLFDTMSRNLIWKRSAELNVDGQKVSLYCVLIETVLSLLVHTATQFNPCAIGYMIWTIPATRELARISQQPEIVWFGANASELRSKKEMDKFLSSLMGDIRRGAYAATTFEGTSAPTFVIVNTSDEDTVMELHLMRVSALRTVSKKAKGTNVEILVADGFLIAENVIQVKGQILSKAFDVSGTTFSAFHKCIEEVIQFLDKRDDEAKKFVKESNELCASIGFVPVIFEESDGFPNIGTLNYREYSHLQDSCTSARKLAKVNVTLIDGTISTMVYKQCDLITVPFLFHTAVHLFSVSNEPLHRKLEQFKAAVGIHGINGVEYTANKVSFFRTLAVGDTGGVRHLVNKSYLKPSENKAHSKKQSKKVRDEDEAEEEESPEALDYAMGEWVAVTVTEDAHGVGNKVTVVPCEEAEDNITKYCNQAKNGFPEVGASRPLSKIEKSTFILDKSKIMRMTNHEPGTGSSELFEGSTFSSKELTPAFSSQGEFLSYCIEFEKESQASVKGKRKTMVTETVCGCNFDLLEANLIPENSVVLVKLSHGVEELGVATKTIQDPLLRVGSALNSKGSMLVVQIRKIVHEETTVETCVLANELIPYNVLKVRALRQWIRNGPDLSLLNTGLEDGDTKEKRAIKKRKGKNSGKTSDRPSRKTISLKNILKAKMGSKQTIQKRETLEIVKDFVKSSEITEFATNITVEGGRIIITLPNSIKKEQVI